MAPSFLTLNDITRQDLFDIFEKTRTLKAEIKEKRALETLKGRVVGILFEKPSTRTRASFEAAALRLGGKTIYLPADELQLKRGEPIKDAARVLGSYLDAVVLRVYAHRTVEEFVQYSGMPVINGLSDLAHPTQAVCDLFTILEVKGDLRGLTVAYIGDGNNVCRSLFSACALTGTNMIAACPKGYQPEEHFFKDALRTAERNDSRLSITEDPREAAEGADILYTDVWISMGEEEQEGTKIQKFDGYQISSDLVEVAAKDVSVMHCLPAHRGLEITEEVIEGPRSIVWQQSENKMYGAAGILDFFLA